MNRYKLVKRERNGIFSGMWRIVKMWLVLRALQKEIYRTDNEKESELIREGKRKYKDREEFIDEIGLSMANGVFYQPDLLTDMLGYQFEWDDVDRGTQDRCYSKVDSLLESAENREFIVRMSKKSGEIDDFKFIRPTAKGDEFCTWWGLGEEVISTHKSLSTLIIIPLVSSIVIHIALLMV